MKRNLLALALLAASQPAYAQQATYNATAPTLVDGMSKPLQSDINGNLKVVPAGNAAAGATDSGNPVKVGGVYNSTLPTYTTGQRGDVQIGARGVLKVEINSGTGSAPNVNGLSVDSVSSGTVGFAVQSAGYVFNGTSWDRVRGDTSGTYAVPAASSAAAAGVTPVTATAASGVAAKTSAGNLYRLYGSATGGVSWLCVVNAIAIPSDGAVSGALVLYARQYAASENVDVTFPIPIRFSTGISAYFSTSFCTTKAAVAANYLGLLVS